MPKNFPSSDKSAADPESKEKDYLSRKYETQCKDPDPLGPDLLLKDIGICSNVHGVYLLLPKLSNCRACRRYKEDSFHYSKQCGTASEAVDAVRSAIPKGFKF